jgi:hypothetical protein
MEKITGEKFDAYMTVHHSGATNMFNVKAVIEYASIMTGVALTIQEVMEIMKNYNLYLKRFKKENQ